MTQDLSIQWKPAAFGRLAVLARTATAEGANDGHLRDWQALMTKLSRFGCVGGLSGPTQDRSGGRLTILDMASVSGGEFRCEFEARELSSFASRALTNVLVYFSTKVVPVHGATVFVPDAWMPDSWPSVNRFIERLPFEWSDERELFTSGFDIVVTSRYEAEAQTLLKVEDAFGHWFSAVNMGCFSSLAYSPADCFVHPGDETRFQKDGLVLSIEESLFAEPEGIDSLLGVFDWLHREVCEIAHVGFYE